MDDQGNEYPTDLSRWLEGAGLPRGGTVVEAVEAVFRLDGNWRLKLNTQEWAAQAVRYLHHQVARRPAGLVVHTQRIYHFIAHRQGDLLFGALLDLFIVLGTRGRELRENLLEKSRQLLSAEQYACLDQSMDAGMDATSTLPDSSGSVLSRSGASGSVFRNADQDLTPMAKAEELLEQARDHMIYGQLDEAQQLLAAAVVRFPWDERLHDELLDIHRHIRDREAFRAIHHQLGAGINPKAVEWRQLAIELNREREG